LRAKSTDKEGGGNPKKKRKNKRAKNTERCTTHVTFLASLAGGLGESQRYG
jgi:hypothetical protein